MNKIKNLLDNKINLFVFVVLFLSMAFGGYKYIAKANFDAIQVIVVHKNTNILKLKDQVQLGCSNIV
jgi:hypothetical protein